MVLSSCFQSLRTATPLQTFGPAKTPEENQVLSEAEQILHPPDKKAKEEIDMAQMEEVFDSLGANDA